MRRILFTVVFSAVLFSIPFQNISSQTDDKPKDTQINSEGSFYSTELLDSDYEQVNVVVYVNVKSYELIDQIGQGGCEQNKETGYCLYLLKAEVKEFFKEKVNKEIFEFYEVTDANYQHKDSLLGEKVVFLNWSDNYPNKKMSLGTMQNSTRSIEQNIIEKMRKIAKKNSNRKS